MGRGLKSQGLPWDLIPELASGNTSQFPYAEDTMVVRVFINKRDLKSHQQWWRNFAASHNYFHYALEEETYWESANKALVEWNARTSIDKNKQPVLVFESDEALSFFLLRWA